MIEFDLQFFAVAIPAVLFAAISKAGFGSGVAFAGTAILALVLPPGVALGVTLPLLMVTDVASLKPYWGKWHWPTVKGILIGAVPGIALGAGIYSFVEADVFRLLIGVMCLLFVGHQTAQKTGLITVARGAFSAPLAWIAGFFAGFTSFVSHAGGPPVAIFMLRQKPDKTMFQATTVVIFWVINVLKFVPYAFLGIFSAQTFLADLYLAPFAVIGAWMGVRAHHWVSDRVFFALSYVMLVLTGLRLIWVAMI